MDFLLKIYVCMYIEVQDFHKLPLLPITASIRIVY